jgi:carbon-monoxide dehydrogenase medium subunit
MRPFPFSYHRPETLDTAFDDLDRYRDDVALYAGGTELLLAMKARVLRYGHLVDLKRISELAGVRLDGNVIVIGALTTHHQLSVNPLLNSHFPTYARLSNHVANIRVRCAGTLGGNLCFAEPHADPPAMLATLEASVTLRDRGTERSVPVADFIKSEFTTARRDGEILTEIRVPMPLAGASYSYDKVGHLSRPAVTLAAGRIPAKSGARYRIWAGAIGDRPIKIESVETALAGVSDTDLQEVLPAAARTAAESLPATDDLYGSADYKRHLASVLIQRTVRQLANEVSGNVH